MTLNRLHDYNSLAAYFSSHAAAAAMASNSASNSANFLQSPNSYLQKTAHIPSPFFLPTGNLAPFCHPFSVLQISYFSGIPFSSLFSAESGKQCRRRKARTVFSDQQLCGLERRFEAQRYLSTPERVELASALNLSETQVSL